MDHRLARARQSDPRIGGNAGDRNTMGGGVGLRGDCANSLLVDVGCRASRRALAAALMSSRRACVMRILCEQDVDRLIEPTAAVEAAAEGYRMHAERLMAEPGRLDLRRAQPKRGALILGGLSDCRDLVVKTNVHAYSGGDNGLRRAGSMLVIWDMHDCIPRALVSAAAFNNHRTAAGFAAAAQRFAPANANLGGVRKWKDRAGNDPLSVGRPPHRPGGNRQQASRIGGGGGPQ